MTDPQDQVHNTVHTRLNISASSSGANVLLAGVPNATIAGTSTVQRIRVVDLWLMASAAVNVKFQSHTTPTDITGLFYLAANGGFVLPYNPRGWFATIGGEGLDINLSGAVPVGGVLHYVTLT